MAHRAIGRKAPGNVVRIGGLAKICSMTTRTGIGRIRIIPMVTGIAIICDGYMRPGERINRIVIKAGRRPGRFAVAGSTIGWELGRNVAWIGSSIVIRGVTPCTSIRCTVVIPVVADSTVIGNHRVCPVQRVIVVVDRESGRRPARSRGMAHRAIGRKAQGNVIGVQRQIKIGGMAGRALYGCTCISICMALDAIHRKVCT